MSETLYELKTDESMDGGRLDSVLAVSFEEASRSYLVKLIETGKVCIDGRIETSKKFKIKRGQNIRVEFPEITELSVEAENIPLDIVYEDSDLLVVNKPKGMVVHPAPGNYSGTLVNAVMYHCGDSLSSINGVVRPGIVHRIDKDTSGLLVIAKNDAAHNGLAKQFEEHSITRTYRAIVYNNFSSDEGTVDAPIGRDTKNRLRRAVSDKADSKRAVTHYKVLERFGKFTYIEARLETGRTHQIRVHMAYINHPLLGDMLYGPSKSVFGCDSQLLHAKTLGFIHPGSGEYIEFDSELTQEFGNILDKLRK